MKKIILVINTVLLIVALPMAVLAVDSQEDIKALAKKAQNPVPITSQPGFLTPAGEGRVNGLGDTTFSSFFSPLAARTTTWGVGPIFMAPTATDDALGSDKWGAGITAITLATPGNWVYGGIVSNVWSVGGSGEQDINLFTFQYFVNYSG